MKRNNPKKLIAGTLVLFLGISFSNLNIFALDLTTTDEYSLAPQDDVCIDLCDEILNFVYGIDGLDYLYNDYVGSYEGYYDRTYCDKTALRFDLGTIDENVASAKLKIKLQTPYYTDHPMLDSYDTYTSLYGNTGNWSLLSESGYGGVTDISPNFPMEDDSTLLVEENLSDITDEDDWVIFDVTDYVNDNLGSYVTFLLTADPDDPNFCFASKGNPNSDLHPQLVITAEEQDSIIEETSASFDRNPDSENNKEIDIGLTLNGNTFEIKNEDTLLEKDLDYIVSNDETTVTLTKEYLSSLSNGETILIFDFSAGEDQIFTVNVRDSTVSIPSEEYSIIPKDDVCIRLSEISYSYGIDGADYLHNDYVGSYYDGNYNRTYCFKTALRFDLGTIDENIASAKLKIKLQPPTEFATDHPILDSYDTDISLYGNTEDWLVSIFPKVGPGGVVSPNFPMEDDSTLLLEENLSDITDEDDWVIFDVTDYVNDNLGSDVSFLLTADPDDPNFCFASKGNPNSDWHPQLVITADMD